MREPAQSARLNASELRLKRRALLAAAFLLLAGLATRLLTLTHNMGMHPDEFVFFYSSESLARFLLGLEERFVEVKEYPEGAFVFQLPFHLAAYGLERLTGVTLYVQTVGRLSALFYFLAAAGLGALILWRFFPRRPGTLPLYALIAVFSLMHIEQSRYGTGDAISAFLLMLLLLFTSEAQRRGRRGARLCLLAAAFAAGAVCAVKYLLIFFLLLPAAEALRQLRRGAGRGGLLLLPGMLAAAALAFFLVSPKTAADPAFVLRVIRTEMGSYVTAGNICEVGGPLNHLASLLLYLSFYSGFPLATLFLATGWTARFKAPCGDARAFLFSRLLPLVLLVFFFYNLFASTLFMRSLYPFFVLSDLYVADEAARWLAGRKGARRTVLILAAALLLRGGGCIAALTEKSGVEKLNALILSAAEEGQESALLLGPGYFLPFDRALLADAESRDTDDARFVTREDLTLRPGELVVCATQEHGRCAPYLFPISDPLAALQIERWESFKALNADCYRGQVYPEAIYWLFGYWIKGTTGTDYEFPSNRVYYRPLG